jgi:hypothetical protein
VFWWQWKKTKNAQILQLRNVLPDEKKIMDEKQKKTAGVMMCHEVDYEIIGDDIQIVEIELDPGETGWLKPGQ